MTAWPYVGFLAMTLAAVAAAAADARSSKRRVAFFVAAIPYGIVLEQLVILRFERYVYNVSAYILTIGDVPIVIGFGWSVILYAGWRTAQELDVNGLAIGAFVALFALHVDIAMDAVAIQVPYWEWTPPGVWFGVPIGNFIGWLSVGVLYGGIWTLVENKISYRAAAVVTPVVATGGLFVPLTLWDMGHRMLPAAGKIAVLVIIVAALVAIVVQNGVQRQQFPRVAEIIVGLYHAWFIVLLVSYRAWDVSLGIPIVSGLAAAIPVLARLSQR